VSVGCGEVCIEDEHRLGGMGSGVLRRVTIFYIDLCGKKKRLWKVALEAYLFLFSLNEFYFSNIFKNKYPSWERRSWADKCVWSFLFCCHQKVELNHRFLANHFSMIKNIHYVFFLKAVSLNVKNALTLKSGSISKLENMKAH
jgi:hypothetical protein